ncbi:helix-hairpin-helix domain-containing protein [Desmospora activa]|uniref:Competence protein ComEA n=1 Tax=Desmospora activa DSM 45169 TaxID=1121389 RepID=A0A2T4ZCD8_9BACL|nr:helix-hairpin-helix domain-containing protein [Desmospora activa]PTM59546.1 competence protein ComEA [Desmospora activa DSM 45169]
MWVDAWSSREKKLAITAGALGLAVVGMTLFWWWGGNEGKKGDTELQADSYQPLQSQEEQKSEQVEDAVELVVDVKGAIKEPGVYRLEAGSRVKDAIKQAGGPTKEADMNVVNLAQPLTDGMALYIPVEGEEPTGVMMQEDSPASAGSGQTGPINLNTATQEQLESLNGIGPAKAEAILRHREEHGPFSSVDELVQVSGIGEKTVEQLRDQVAVH